MQTFPKVFGLFLHLKDFHKGKNSESHELQSAFDNKDDFWQRLMFLSHFSMHPERWPAEKLMIICFIGKLGADKIEFNRKPFYLLFINSNGIFYGS